MIASRIDEVGVEHRLLVLCKDNVCPVGVENIQWLFGDLSPGQPDRAVIVAPAGLTDDARRLADDRGVIVWDELRLAELESQVGD